MKVSVRVEYALRALCHLAQRYELHTRASIEEMAGSEAIPANYLVQILTQLREAGLVVSRRGKSGGYLLARAPEAITVAEVVACIDGGLMEFDGPPRGQSGRAVRDTLVELKSLLEARAAAMTLDRLVLRPDEAMWHI